MKIKNAFVCGIMSILMCFTAVIFPAQKIIAEENGEKKEYIVKEDAYIRDGGNASKNYSYESITSAHGSQYDGKGYKVINTKSFTNGGEIISVMKFDLPTKQEVEDGNLDKFEFVFNIFKNADYKNGPQTYQFYHTVDVDWLETSLTWNNKPDSISRNSEDILFEFTIDQGTEYEFMSDNDKRIHIDISEEIEDLIDAGHEEITIFSVAKESKNTSLMIHSKETSDSEKPARIIASSEGITLESLKSLIEDCSSLDKNLYTVESFQNLTLKLEAAKEIAGKQNPTIEEIKKVYRDLKAAQNSLVTLEDPSDPDNIAYQRPVRSNLSKTIVDRVNDGDISTTWSGTFYPAYVDIDLMDTYKLDKVKIYIPEGKTCYYTLYGSNDGVSYDRIYQKRDKSSATLDGDEIIFNTPETYRIIRVYLEYTEGDDKAYLSEVKAYGTKTDTNIEELREGSLEEILDMKSFDETDYANPINNDEIYENIYGIIDRTVGAEYRNWFSFEIDKNSSNDNDYFELSDKGGKVHIKGNEGLSLSTGLNYYYKNYVNVHISEQTMQTNMPEQIVPIGETIRKETPYKVRYAFNYCTLSYTFAFFGEEDWQRENDWLALNGVNVVLDLAGQEATWIKFLMNFGYSFDDAKDWLTGPAYYAWQFMDNMESFGGPIPDGYVIDRVNLARNSQRWKNSLGMQTIIQGYAGMVPTNFNEYQPNVKVVKQGNWNGYARPDMINTDSQEYIDYSKLFYEAQEFVYGKNSHYYAVDPFHEGGIRPSGLTDEIISEKVLDSLLDYDEDAVWIVQGWQSNPTNSLLKGMGDRRENHVLIVDLIKYPIKSWTKYNKLKYDSTTLDSVEFNGTPWAWGLLANFGGNPSMHGQMEVMVEDILEAQKTTEHMAGLGIISEAQYDNPIMYDLIFDLAWADETFDLNQWINKYIERRYGGTSENVKLAWQTMKSSNYNHGVRFTNELFGMKGKAPQDYGTQNIPYGAEKLETAFLLLIEDFDKFKDSECYLYDLTEIMRQLGSNYAVLTYNDVLKAKNDKDLESFKESKDKFLKTFEVVNAIQVTQKEQLAGEWIGKAQDQGSKYDDFSKDAFAMNAKALITSWGSRSGHRSLKDYGWRNYEGMFMDLYGTFWSDYLDKVENNLDTGVAINTLSKNDYFDVYWEWNCTEQNYTREAKNSPEELKAVIDLVLENCMISGKLDPNAGNLALNRVVTSNTKNTVGKEKNVTDGSESTLFTAKATNNDGKIEKPEVIIDLVGEFHLSKINILLDYEGDKYYNYEIYGSDDGEKWTKLAEKKSTEFQDEDGETYKIDEDVAKYIKVIATRDSEHLNDEENTEISIQEIRIYGERVLPTLTQLERLVSSASTLDASANKTSDVKKFEDALETAKNSLANEAALDEVDNVYWILYESIVSLDLSGLANLALNKEVEAMNDPDGNSYRAVDGEVGTVWNSGRLSLTGAPYEETITPGWLVVDLGAIYNISELRVLFKEGTTTWHMYEIYTSLDKENWTKVAEKTTENSPNEEEDYYDLDKVNARYVKLVTTNIKVGNDSKRMAYEVSELMILGSNTKIESDKTILNETIVIAQTLNYLGALDDVSQWVKDTFDLALADALVMVDKLDATQDEVDAVTDTLIAAMDLLEYIKDKKLLGTLISECEKIDLKEYEEIGQKEFLDALTDAKEIYENDLILDETISEAFDVLTKAKAALLKKEVLDKSRLDEMIAISQKAADNPSQFKQDGAWENFVNTLVEAKNVRENAKTQGEINQMTKKLSDSYKSLRVLISDELLQDLENFLKEVEGLDFDKYSKETQKAIKEAIDLAKKVLEGESFTQDELLDVFAKISRARILIANPDSIETIENSGTNTGDSTNISFLILIMLCASGAIVISKRKLFKK